MAWKQCLVASSLLIAFATVLASEEAAVKIGPSSIKKVVGGNIKIRCKTSIVNATLEWLGKDEQVITTNTTHRVHVNEKFALMLNRLEVNDTAQYVCRTKDGAYNATTLLTVYIMPDYFFEGLVIMIINGCLILIFFACLVRTWLNNRRLKNKAEQKQVM